MRPFVLKDIKTGLENVMPLFDFRFPKSATIRFILTLWLCLAACEYNDINNYEYNPDSGEPDSCENATAGKCSESYLCPHCLDAASTKCMDSSTPGSCSDATYELSCSDSDAIPSQPDCACSAQTKCPDAIVVSPALDAEVDDDAESETDASIETDAQSEADGSNDSGEDGGNLLGGIVDVACEQQGETGIVWPNHARIAVSLTYDDAFPTHISEVGPALKSRGFKGTFFINSGRFEEGAFLRQQVEPWQELYLDGHEFGSHTVNHVCDADWVSPEKNLKDLNVDDIMRELVDSVEFLRTLGADNERYTFAYPCGQYMFGYGDANEETGMSYKPIVEYMFLAARGTDWGTAWPSVDMDMHEIPGYAVVEASEGGMAGWLDHEENNGGWIIYTLHGVGGDPNMITVNAHEALLDHLDEIRDSVWVETFGTVASYIKRCAVN